MLVGRLLKRVAAAKAEADREDVTRRILWKLTQIGDGGSNIHCDSFGVRLLDMWHVLEVFVA